jgi:hypothetical protein
MLCIVLVNLDSIKCDKPFSFMPDTIKKPNNRDINNQMPRRLHVSGTEHRTLLLNGMMSGLLEEFLYVSSRDEKNQRIGRRAQGGKIIIFTVCTNLN